MGHIDLVTLLDSGIPVRLPGRKHLNIGVLHPQSALVGGTVQSCYRAAGNGDLEVVADLARRRCRSPDSAYNLSGE